MNWINLLYFLFGLTLFFSIHDVVGIRGGEKAKVGEYTYQVSIMQTGHNKCGGSILDDYHVITAAHCVVRNSTIYLKESMKILAGVNKIGSNSTSKVLVDVEKAYALREFVYSHYYKPCSSGDIAVLKLKNPLGIDSNPNLSKIRLPEKKSYVNETAIVTGFGWEFIKTNALIWPSNLYEKSGYSRGELRFAEAKVRSNQECQKFYKFVTEGCLCAQVMNKKDWTLEGPCNRDDGGPLVYNGNVLIGVLSYRSFSCSDSRTPAVYASVLHHLDFIQKAIKDESDPAILKIIPKTNT